MRIFTLEPFTGHIQDCAKDAKEIANAFPQHEFFLRFNDVTVSVSGHMSVQEIVNAYHVALNP